MEPTPLQTNEIPIPQPEQDTPPTRPGDTWRDYLLLLLGSGSLVALDTWTKALVTEKIPMGGSWLPDGLSWLHPYARFIHTSNVGTAFSMFDSIPQINLIIGILAAVVSVAVIIIFPQIDRHEKLLRAAIILQLAGAVGNLISRIRYGHVVDFVSVGDFAVFNVADACITVGVALMILSIILDEIKTRKKKEEETGTEESQSID